MSWVAVGISAATLTASIAYSEASKSGMPKQPDLAASSRAGIEAEAETLGERRAMESAAQQGAKAEYTTAARKEKQAVQYVHEPASTISNANGERRRGGQGKLVPYVAADWEAGGKYYKPGQAAPQIITRKQTVNVPAGKATADFTGYGEADVQGKIARKNAQNILDLEKKYGSQFIEEALKEQQLADPQGTAARAQLYDLIKEQEDQNPDRPVAALLDSQVADQLKAGRGLDRVSDSVLREAVGKAQAARGQAPTDAEQFAEPLTTGFEGEQRLDAAEQKALGYLTSGATPEDVKYRREQQTLANLSSFVNNRTPESQFASLSGAQQGPAPYNTGTPLARQNQNVGPAAASAATQGWNMQLGAQLNQADPWMAGLSASLKAANAVGSSRPRTT